MTRLGTAVLGLLPFSSNLLMGTLRAAEELDADRKKEVDRCIASVSPKIFGSAKAPNVPVYQGAQSNIAFKLSSTFPYVEQYLSIQPEEIDRCVQDDRGQLEFEVGHELVHYKERHFSIFVGTCGGGLAAANALFNKFVKSGGRFPVRIGKGIGRFIAVGIGGNVGSSGISQPLEKRADLKWFEACSDEGKEAAPRFMQFAQYLNLAAKREAESELGQREPFITEEGDSKLDFYHPPLSVRKAYLRKALKEDLKKKSV